MGAVVLGIVGVPPIDVHGPLHYVGVMDPLCGGTRAMFLLLSGERAAAWQYNPVVFAVAAAIVLLVMRAAVGWSTGRWFDMRLPSTVRRVLVAVVVIATVVLWIRQQLHAELLMSSWR